MRERYVLRGHTGPVWAVAATVIDGRPHAITGSGHDLIFAWVREGESDNTVRVWDLGTGEQVGQPLTGHTGPVRAVVATTIDGRPHAITGSDDKTVRVWDLTTGQQIGQPLTGHTDEVNAVAATVIDGRPHAITGGEDETVRVWDLSY